MNVYTVTYRAYGYIDVICAKSEANARLISNYYRDFVIISGVSLSYNDNAAILKHANYEEGYQYYQELSVNGRTYSNVLKFKPVNVRSLKLERIGV